MKGIIISVLCVVGLHSFAQSPDSLAIINEKDAAAIVGFLASDSLRGRANGSPELLQAATFIGKRYEAYGLKYFPGKDGYGIPFFWDDESHPRYRLYNMVGILPGKSKPHEMVFFSSHYDHVGVGETGKDTIYNGANDNASGTAALLMLAHYFSVRNDNERTLVFCAFAGEEEGLLGSNAFSFLIKADSAIADINLEMLGYPQFGKHNLIIDGGKYSNLPALLYQGLREYGVKLKGEPPESSQMFQRSDNYNFAKKGIPAHTITSSDDNEPCYHQPCDDVNHMDFEHLAFVTRAIAFASKDIIKGTVTPGRINKNDLLPPKLFRNTKKKQRTF